jgi:hypothetical protein
MPFCLAAILLIGEEDVKRERIESPHPPVRPGCDRGATGAELRRFNRYLSATQPLEHPPKQKPRQLTPPGPAFFQAA